MQKDKIKAPFSEECIDIAWYPLSSLCPRDFYRSQSDKHSDLRGHASVTVMAVATDFHRDSLITLHAVLRLFGNELKIRMNCVYSFVKILLSKFFCQIIFYHTDSEKSIPRMYFFSLPYISAVTSAEGIKARILLRIVNLG